MEKYLILCGANSNRFNANINHQRYADWYNVEYEFIIKKDIANPFFIKPHCIIEALEEGYTHILCIDDDAFFINNDWNFRNIFYKYAEDLIVTAGRKKKNGTTLFNAGVMFIRNTDNMKFLFDQIFNIKDPEMSQNWQEDWGPLVGNEQPRLIYTSQTNFPEAVRILDYPGFNAHEISFKKKGFLETSPPIVHVTGQNKENKIKRFEKFTGIKLP